MPGDAPTERPDLRTAETRVCTSCDQEKPLDAFCKVSGKPYRRHLCKACHAGHQRGWRDPNREAKAARKAAARQPRPCAGCERAEDEHLHLPLFANGVETATALIDVADAWVVKGYTWWTKPLPSVTYVNGMQHRTRRHVKLHRVLLGGRPGLHIDHVNHDGLDNRRCNLRHATPGQNLANRRDARRPDGSFVGVQSASGGRFRSCIRIDNQQLSLGVFDTAEAAARARDAAACAAWGEFATLAFPDEHSDCSCLNVWEARCG